MVSESQPPQSPWSLQLPNGVTIKQGEYVEFSEYHSLQRTVMPVISINGDEVVCWGSAVSIGAGWFVTARHVLADFHAAREVREGGTLFVVWETDTKLPLGGENYLGMPLEVLGYHMHPDTGVDLATLTVDLPPQAPSEILPVQLELRMPELGEAIIVVGYPSLNGSLHRDADEKLTIEWERTMGMSLGEVTEQQGGRLDRQIRGGPGFVTDAPTPPGTSGGAVLDGRGNCLGFVSSSFEPSKEYPLWNSFIALLGPVLELSVLDLEVGVHNSFEAPGVRVAALVADGVTSLTWDDPTFDVDPKTRKAFYHPS